MKKIWKYVLVLLALAVFGGTFGYLFQNSRNKADVFELVAPEVKTLERSTVLTGKIEPRNEILIKPQISGIISEVMVEPGDVVKPGDVIARISVVPEAVQLSSAENRVSLAEMNLDQAKREYERMSKLKDKNFVSVEDWEQSRLAYNRALEERASAIDNLNIVKEGVSEKNAKMSNTLVRSTIAGVVLDVPVKRGNSVIMANTLNDGTTIAVIADMNDLVFRGKIDETEIGDVRKGMPMEIKVGALPKASLKAVLEYISPKSVEQNGSTTFEIKGAVERNDSIELRAGYSANATIILRRAENVLTLPENVLLFEGDSTFVNIVADTLHTDRAERRPVITGMSDGISIEIISGVDKNEKVQGMIRK